MKISIFGLGYVGAVSCACLARLGHELIGVDIAEAKVKRVNQGKSPLIENGLEPLLAEATRRGQLRATTDPEVAVEQSEAAMLCVGTPSTPSGGIDTQYLETVCTRIGEALRNSDHKSFVVFTRSTSLPPVHKRLMEILTETSGRPIGQGLGYVCHPEFMREGSAIDDFWNPPKIVFGASDPHSQSICQQLYPGIEAPTSFVPPEVAAMIKYADNCFHATKITFGNEIGAMCKQLNVDSHQVMDVFCQDVKLNLSHRYLRPGFAFGGSCLPKDLRAMIDQARLSAMNLPMLGALIDSNEHQIQRLVARVTTADRTAVGMIGLAFKEGTDDVRESPMVAVVEQLSGKGHQVKIFDQHLSVQELVGANRSFALSSISHLAQRLTDDLQSVVDGSDILIISHRLKPEIWDALKIPHEKRIFDLVRVESLQHLPNYEGLYW